MHPRQTNEAAEYAPFAGMRIVSWNVNGLRKLWPLEKLFERLNGDILCFQETRVSGEWDPNLESLAFVKGYDSFFSICKQKRGYSGVATFCRKGVATPFDAGEGLTSNVGGAAVDFESDGSCGECEFQNCACEHKGCPKDALSLIEEEGRCVITDHHRFVLINIYIPAVSVEGRSAFKMQFLHALRAKVDALRLNGRKVIIVGDFNICPTVMDSAEPVPKSLQEAWEQRPSRKWLAQLTSRRGPNFVDAFRKMHPTAADAFTCWSEATRARENNHGVRIDLIIMDRDLFAEDVESADIRPDVFGSDHCPVIVYLKCPEALPEIPQNPPRFCTRYMRRFSVRQKSLRDILAQGSARERFRMEAVSAVDSGPKSNQVRRSLTGINKTRLGTNASAQLFGKRKSKSRQASISTFFVSTASNGFGMTKAAPQPDSPETQEQPRSINSIAGPVPTSVTRRKETAEAWRKLLSGPPPPPLCKHGTRCVLKTVTRPGVNKGRTFFSCPYPAGVGKNADCHFFKWASFKVGVGLLPG